MPHVRHWPAISVLLAVAALLLGLLAADTSWLQPYGLAADVAIATDLRSAFLTPFMEGISLLASPAVGVVGLLAWVGLLVVWRRRPVAAVATALVVAVGWGVALVGKVVVARERPPVDVVHSLAPETGATSYPSGHVAFAVSVAIAAWFLARGTSRSRLVAAVGIVWVTLVAFSRLYLGVHYPGDVVGSVLISSSAIVALTGVWHRSIVARLPGLPVIGALVARYEGASGTVRASRGDERELRRAT